MDSKLGLNSILIVIVSIILAPLLMYSGLIVSLIPMFLALIAIFVGITARKQSNTKQKKLGLVGMILGALHAGLWIILLFLG